jgi:NADH-quinone oxidoreductase subunit L
MLFGGTLKDAIYVNHEVHKALDMLREEFHGPLQMAIHGLSAAPFWLALAGVAAAYYLYMVNTKLPDTIKCSIMPIFKLLDNKYYMDWFNENVLAASARGLGVVFWKVGDQSLIDGVCVNGSWRAVGWFSGIVRKLQTGYLYDYALTMLLGVFVLMTYFVWLK